MISSRRTILIGLSAVALVPVGVYVALHKPFPSDTTPAGAYMRLARSVAIDDPKGFFAYLETEAQWACYTLRDMRKKAQRLVLASYPEPERSERGFAHEEIANAPDGSDVFALLYRSRGWARRLRKDLSGVKNVEIEHERASVVTVQGTRWPFRRRDNGIWGLTIFTAELLADAEKATRDLAAVESAAADYERLNRR